MLATAAAEEATGWEDNSAAVAEESAQQVQAPESSNAGEVPILYGNASPLMGQVQGIFYDDEGQLIEKIENVKVQGQELTPVEAIVGKR